MAADATYQALVHTTGGPNTLTVESGGKIDVLSGGVIALNGTNLPATVSMAVAAGSANIAEITFTVKDNGGTTLAAVWQYDIWLSDDADGEGLTSTGAS